MLPGCPQLVFCLKTQYECEWMLFQSVLTTCSKLDIVTVFSGGIKEKERRAAQILKPVGEDLCFAVLLGLVVPRMLGASGRDSD
jgi:hypothetical protein